MLNKNVSVWRGALTPPTHSHIWVKDDSNIYVFKYNDWRPLIEDSSTQVSGLMSKEDKQILNMLNENLHWN